VCLYYRSSAENEPQGAARQGYQSKKIMNLYLWMLSRYLRIYLRIWHWKVFRTNGQINKDTNIPKNEILKALKLILESTYFKFNEIIYK